MYNNTFINILKGCQPDISKIIEILCLSAFSYLNLNIFKKNFILETLNHIIIEQLLNSYVYIRRFYELYYLFYNRI